MKDLCGQLISRLRTQKFAKEISQGIDVVKDVQIIIFNQILNITDIVKTDEEDIV